MSYSSFTAQSGPRLSTTGAAASTLTGNGRGAPRLAAPVTGYFPNTDVMRNDPNVLRAIQPSLPGYNKSAWDNPTLPSVGSGPRGANTDTTSITISDRGIGASDVLSTINGMQQDPEGGNTYVTYTYLSRPIQGAPEHETSNGQVVLAYQAERRVHQGEYSDVEVQLYDHLAELQTMCTLPVVNSLLAQERVGSEKKLHQVLDDWKIMGTITSESGNDSSESGREMLRTRELVTTIAGTVDTVDIWSTEKSYICKNMTLWLILKRVERHPVQYVLDGKGHFRFSYENLVGEGKPYVEKPFQFVPYASHNYETPPIEELVYTESDGRKEIGVAFAVGRVRDMPPGRDMYSFGPDAWHDATVVPHLPKFEMVARMRCP